MVKQGASEAGDFEKAKDVPHRILLRILRFQAFLSQIILLYAILISNWTAILLGALGAFGLSGLLIYVVYRAYSHIYRNGSYEDMTEFYKTRCFIVFRSILFSVAYVLVYLIIL